MNRLLLATLLLGALGGCDDGGGAADSGGGRPPDAAPPPPPPPPPLTGLFHERIRRTGGDCPASVQPQPRSVFIQETDGAIEWRAGEMALTGTRDRGSLTAAGAGPATWGGCAVQESVDLEGAVRAPGNAFTATGRSALTPAADCDFSACSVEWVARAARIGGRSAGAYTGLSLDPGDLNVEAAARLGDAAWFGTLSPAGARVWRLVHDSGVPTLDAMISDGFRSEAPELAGNNIAVLSLTRALDALYAGTWDASAAALATLGIEAPPGDGFDLWRYDGEAWSAVTTDGFGDPDREAATALTEWEGRLFVGTRDSVGGAAVLEVMGALGRRSWPAAGAEPGPLDPGSCATEVTSLVGHDGALYAAVSGPECPSGAFVLRLAAGEGAWTLASEGGLGLGVRRVALVSDGAVLFALGDHPQGAALLRHVSGRQWTPVAASGFGDGAAQHGARHLSVHAGDLLLFPVDGAGGGSVWASGGGLDPRDLTRIAAGDPLHEGLGLGAAFTFEERLYVGTRGLDLEAPDLEAASPAVLLRASTLLAERGPGTVRTARDGFADKARGAATACHRDAVFFNPALQNDQRLEVILPPGVDPEDDVLLAAVYVLMPFLDAPPPTPGATPSARAAARDAWFAEATPAYGAVAGCLAGRRATVPCAEAEDDRACLERCLADRLPHPAGGALGPDDAAALVEPLGPITLPVSERFAVVLVETGAGFALDQSARYAPVLAGRDPTGALWPGDIGAWQAALEEATAAVERCWPRSIRGAADARFVFGADAAALSVVEVLRERPGLFAGGVAWDGVFSPERWTASAAQAALAGRPPPAAALGEDRAPVAFISARAPTTCRQRVGACETAAYCAASAAAALPGDALTTPGGALHAAHARVAGLGWLSALRRGEVPGGELNCPSPPADCSETAPCPP